MSAFDYLMQDDIPIRRLTETSSNGAKTYNPPRNQPPAIIKGRLQFSRKLIVKADGEQAVSEAVLYTVASLAPGDLVIHQEHEWPVLAVPEKRGLFGGVDHREVRL